VVNPDLELWENRFVLLALPTFLPSVISSFLPEIRGKESSHIPFTYTARNLIGRL